MNVTYFDTDENTLLRILFSIFKKIEKRILLQKIFQTVHTWNAHVIHMLINIFIIFRINDGNHTENCGS